MTHEALEEGQIANILTYKQALSNSWPSHVVQIRSRHEASKRLVFVACADVDCDIKHEKMIAVGLQERGMIKPNMMWPKCLAQCALPEISSMSNRLQCMT